MDSCREQDVSEIPLSRRTFIITSGSFSSSRSRSQSNSTSSTQQSFLTTKSQQLPSTDITRQSISINDMNNATNQNVNDMSWKRNPNFFKIDRRINTTNSDLTLAAKAGISRYCIRNFEPQKQFDEYFNPYYYYSVKVPPSLSSSATSSSTSMNESPSHSSTVIGSFNDKQFPDSCKLHISECVMTTEELNNLDQEFEADINPFKRRIDYFNPYIYLKHYRFSQCVAAGLLLSVVVFGSFGYLITVAQQAYKKPPPEVYEILSPYIYPHLSAIRRSLIDPDTPKQAYTKSSLLHNESWELVFSEEFNAEGRTFFPGDDQFFEALDIHYAATNNLEYYIPEMVSTSNGSLNIKLDAFPTNGLQYRSAMLLSWNKMCFSENAIVEVSVKFPGSSQETGLWPAVWSLGNLARPGYQATTDGVWPYTYDECDYGITPNQSSPDGISYLPGQRLNKCVCFGEDHPNLGTGRGAPEIDIIEGFRNPHDEHFVGMQTLQIAPFDPWYMPDYDYMSIANSNITAMKSSTGSQTQEAIAAGTTINGSWFNNVGNETSYFQKYGFEYNSNKVHGNDSYIQFFIGDESTVGIRGDALHPRTNIGYRQITKEPMAMIFNLALSETWLTIDFTTLTFPAVFEIDYIRIYQPKDEVSITCDPHGYPTTDYIQKHLAAYENANFTTWKQAGYTTPKNSIMNGCQLPYGVFENVS